MNKGHHRPARHHRQKRAFWFDLGRLLFPDLITNRRAMQARMVAITIGLAAILVGATIGFIRNAANPSNVLLIQARESQK